MVMIMADTPEITEDSVIIPIHLARARWLWEARDPDHGEHDPKECPTCEAGRLVRVELEPVLRDPERLASWTVKNSLARLRAEVATQAAADPEFRRRYEEHGWRFDFSSCDPAEWQAFSPPG
jgi:hypothetical protein